MKEIQQQIEMLTEKMEQSNYQNASVEREIQTNIQESKSYRTEIGDNTPCGLLNLSDAIQSALKIRARNSPKKCTTSAVGRKLDDAAAIHNILNFMNIEGR